MQEKRGSGSRFSAEMYSSVDTVEGDSTDDAFLQKDTGGFFGANPTDEILLFVARVDEVM